jgi:hypothetical protein
MAPTYFATQLYEKFRVGISEIEGKRACRGAPEATAHAEIARAVVAARAICNPYRAAEARRQPVKRRRANSTRQ